MRFTIPVVLLSLLCSCSPVARRRALQGMACAAGAADMVTTRQVLSRGGYETNPVMAGRAAIPIKVGICVAPIVAAEVMGRHRSARWRRDSDLLWTVGAAGTAGAYGIIAAQNSRLNPR